MAIIQPAELRETIDNPAELLKSIQAAHELWAKGSDRRKKMDDYYRGEHDILKRKMRDDLPNNRIVANYAKYITDMATGYLIGTPVTYSEDDEGTDLEVIREAYTLNDTGSLDADIAKDCSVFGVGYELDYQSEVGRVRIAVLDPQKTFLVVDDTIEARPLYGVYVVTKTDTEGEDVFEVTAYTESQSHTFSGKEIDALEFTSSTPHAFGRVPLIEYANNEEEVGDFEPVIGLIDAYNQTISDRLNAKEQDIDALLALYGVEAPDPETAQRMREDRIVGLPIDAKAGWLTKQLSEADNETVRNALNEDIHKFSMIPDLTDQNFAGNASGVAMEYKLMGFDQMIAIKQRYFKAGLRRRLENFLATSKTRATEEIDTSGIEIHFTRNMPVNEVELAQVVSALDGIISRLTQYSLLPMVKDPQKELEQLRAEQEESLEAQRKAFGSPEDGRSEPPVEDDEE